MYSYIVCVSVFSFLLRKTEKIMKAYILVYFFYKQYRKKESVANIISVLGKSSEVKL